MLKAEIEVPRTVMVPRGRKTVTVDVVCRLHNEGEHSAVMASPEGEEVYFWHVLNSAQREVDRSKPSKAAAKVSSEMVAAGASYAQPQRVTLNAAKLRSGQVYHLRMRIMGRTAEGEFTVFHQRALAKAAKKAKKAVAKKKAAKKKAAKAKKKTAKKKTAKKKTVKRPAKKGTKARKTKTRKTKTRKTKTRKKA